MSRQVRRAAAAALLIAWLQHPGAADPVPPGAQQHDPVAAPTPWIDLGSAPIVPDLELATDGTHKVAAALTLGGVYAAFTTWTYFAWYRKHKPLSQFRWGGDGWLG